MDKKSEIRKIILTEIEDDIIGPRKGIDEIISENPTTTYLSGVLFPKETSVEADNEGELESEPEEKSSPNMGMKPSSMGLKLFF